MKKQEYMLIALDMDGTLLNSGQEITPRACRVIAEILRQGKQVVFSTGRCIGEMEAYLDAFPSMRYLVCENGACVYDLQKKEHIARRPLLPGQTLKVIECVEGEDILTSFFMGNRPFMDSAYMQRLGEFGLGEFDRVFRRSVVRVDNLFSFYREKPLEVEKINLFFKDDGSRRRTLEKISRLPLSLASSLAGNLEINAWEANKGEGLKLLCSHLKIPMESVIAIGDNSNDVEMLGAAGFPVAMGNAVPRIKALAKEITEDCDHDGAAIIMEKYML